MAEPLIADIPLCRDLPHPSGPVPRRVAVIGTSGSGKTMLARRLSEILQVPYVELDALSWGPNWTEVRREILRERVMEAVSAESWVVDGNYGHLRDIIWPHADTVVWLDFSFPLVFGRVLWRTIRRIITREELWSGNRESFRIGFMSQDSILLWVLQTYWRRRRDYPQILKQPEYAHLHVVHLRSPKEAEAFLQAVVR